LVLSKALGTGIVGSAIKAGRASEEQTRASFASMTRLNDQALALARRFGITACTDVTGFGLLGHLRNICRGSDLAATIWPRRLIALPGALEGIRAGKVPGGTRANLDFVRPGLGMVGEEDEALTLLAADAQTSGGLLCCVPPEEADALVAELEASGHAAAHIGVLVERSSDAPDWACTLDFAAG
jgi:selenide,water dikinase